MLVCPTEPKASVAAIKRALRSVAHGLPAIRPWDAPIMSPGAARLDPGAFGRRSPIGPFQGKPYPSSRERLAATGAAAA